MNAALHLDDYQWLVSPAAEPYLVAAATDTRPLHAQLQSLRSELSAQRAHLVLEQAELRGRARAKFHFAEHFFFDRVGLEQATDDITAAYKAERFLPGHPVADLCCGIGGDLMALAKRGAVLGVERNECLATLAGANASIRCRLSNASGGDVSVQSGDASACDLASFSAWHIDPDRRPQGRRTTRVALHEPGSEVWARYLQQNPNGVIKLAPAADLTQRWEEQHELEWISRDGSCRQLVVWCGSLASSPGARRATVLSGTHGLRRSVVGRPAALPPAASIKRFLFEPDAAVLAADLVAALAAERALEAVIPGGGYLTGDAPIVDDPALAAFEVQEIIPFQLKRVKGILRERGIGALEVKKRGVEHSPEKLCRELKTPGENAATLFITRLPTGITAILARRMKTR